MSLIDAWLARGEMREINGDDVFVVDLRATRETAPPVLVLHGFPTSTFDWRHTVDALGTHRRVVLCDLPGYGLSAKPDRAYSLFAQADVVEALARSIGLTEVALVTHDMGNSVGGELLARDVEGALAFSVVRRVLTNGSIYIDMAHLTDGQQLLLSLPDAALPPESALPLAAVAAGLRVTFAAASTVSDDEVAAMAELVVRDGGGRLLPRIIRYVEERRVHERRWTGAIEEHPAPLHVVWGDQDPVAVWPMVERLSKARLDAVVTVLDGVGHYPMVEAPERFREAIIASLG